MTTQLPCRPDELRALFLFEALTAEQLAVLCADGHIEQYQPGPICVEGEPATGPWYGVRYSETTFGIFETFPSVGGRQAHVDGGGGDIFRDLERMNAILAAPAHVQKMDVLLSKQVFTWRGSSGLPPASGPSTAAR